MQHQTMIVVLADGTIIVSLSFEQFMSTILLSFVVMLCGSLVDFLWQEHSQSTRETVNIFTRKHLNLSKKRITTLHQLYEVSSKTGTLNAVDCRNIFKNMRFFTKNISLMA